MTERTVQRWCGRAAAGSETAAMNPMVEWHGDADEDTPYVLASDYDALERELAEAKRSISDATRERDEARSMRDNYKRWAQERAVEADQNSAYAERFKAALRRIAITNDEDCRHAHDSRLMTEMARQALAETPEIGNTDQRRHTAIQQVGNGALLADSSGPCGRDAVSEAPSAGVSGATNSSPSVGNEITHAEVLVGIDQLLMGVPTPTHDMGAGQWIVDAVEILRDAKMFLSLVPSQPQCKCPASAKECRGMRLPTEACRMFPSQVNSTEPDRG